MFLIPFDTIYKDDVVICYCDFFVNESITKIKSAKSDHIMNAAILLFSNVTKIKTVSSS